MNKEKEYTIIVRRERVVVTYDVYKAYHAEREHARYLDKEARSNEISIEWLEDNGVNPTYDDTAPSPLEIVILQEQIAKLLTALHSLPPDEHMLIHSLFFERKSERQMARKLGISQPIINKRKNRILEKLKNIMEI